MPLRTGVTPLARYPKVSREGKLSFFCQERAFRNEVGLQNPDKTVVEVRVNRFHIIQRDWLPQQLLVKGQSEASINVVAVKHRHAHDSTHEMKV